MVVATTVKVTKSGNNFWGLISLKYFSLRGDTVKNYELIKFSESSMYVISTSTDPICFIIVTYNLNISHRRSVLSTEKQSIFPKIFVGKFMICLHTKFCIPSSNDSFASIKPIFFYSHSGGWSPKWIHSVRQPFIGLL
jgi:hypothetical protein